jgi:multidrug efflux pump subunit AcrA (membrane-fusion protein)
MYPYKHALLRIISFILLAAVLAGCSTGTATSNTALIASTGTVKTITAVTSVSGSGTTSALQTVSVSWKTTGTIGAVNVKTGDQVKAGGVLMSIDAKSASAAMLQAQAELSSSVKALNDLLHPSALSVANAQQAVAKAQDSLDKLQHPTASALAAAQQAVVKAQDTLDTAQQTLGNSKTVDLAYYQEQVQKAQDALTNAEHAAAPGAKPVDERHERVQQRQRSVCQVPSVPDGVRLRP